MNPAEAQAWIEAGRRHRLSTVHVQMARFGRPRPEAVRLIEDQA